MKDPTYFKYLSDRMWHEGLHLFADADTRAEIQRIAFQVSIKKIPVVVETAYKGAPVYLLYTEDNLMPIPSRFFYDVIEPEEAGALHLTDMISAFKGGAWNVDPSQLPAAEGGLP